MSKKRLRRERARLKHLRREGILAEQPEAAHEDPKKRSRRKAGSVLDRIREIYEKDYKKLLWITWIILALAIAQIAWQTASTGDFLNKGVSLKGGITLTIPGIDEDAIALEQRLKGDFKGNDISVRTLNSAGVQSGIVIDADITDSEGIDSFTSHIRDTLSITKDDYSLEIIGSALGASFFRETIKAIYIAFLAMGAVVFLYFGVKAHQKIMSVALTIVAAVMIFGFNSSVTNILAYVIGLFLILTYVKESVPSVAVIFAAMCDIIITLAIVNVIGMKISTAGIAAFLMLIGYSVDTDILLSTKVLRRKEGSVLDGVYSAIKTGMTMSITTIVAAAVALLFSQSEVLKQIMMIILIGLIVDLLTTWIQNAGILRWYLEKNPEKGEIKTS